ncbi:MAG: phenylalanine--tRNA ligase subunit beta [Actinobacteria bacterium]|nr:phenylalanine--tRNA ligase subunit beta [Actinomycetota bacterium]
MRAPLGWLREWTALPESMTGRELAEVLIRAGLEVETVDEAGAEITGPVVVGRVLKSVDEPQKNGKTIRWVQVDVGLQHNEPHPDYPQGCRSVVCGAHNFAAGDLVVVSLPGSVLAGGFAISARKTYGHVSDGMICAEDELGIGHDHTGIIVLPADAGLAPGDDPSGILLLRDDILDIDVSPDIGYCLSIRGLARESAQNLGLAFTDVVDRATPASKADGYPVVLDDPACPLFVALTVTGIDPARPTPRWMARRLTMAGMRSISLAVDITNYVMLETGQPLHAYDATKLAGPIRVRKATGGEQIVTLDDVTRTLHADDLLITDDSGPIGIAGVMGGATTEIDAATTDIVLEAAHFDSSSIGWTLRRHNLPSEASKRFHRGVDPDAAYAAAHRAARLLVELAGGTLSAAETVAGAVPAMPTQAIPAGLPARILGTPVSAEQVAEILRASGVVVEVSGDAFRLLPPTWRPDLRDPYDYVEEVGRKLGFDTLPAPVPRAPVGRGYTPEQRARRAINAAAVAAGFVEVLSFPFSSAEDLDRMGVAADDRRRALVRLHNPLAETQPDLRTTMLPGLFAAIARNTSRGNDDLALFEVGRVFFAGDGTAAPIPGVAGRPSADELAAIEAALPTQPRHFGAVLTGYWRRPGWQGAGIPAGWEQAFALADIVAGAVGATLERSSSDRAPWHPGRCAALTVAGEVIGHAGELHPTVCRDFGLPARTAAVELDLDALIRLAPARGSITAVSSHPVAKEDVALVVADDVPVAQVKQALSEGAGDLLESLALFDIYTGSQVPAGHRSLAFALRFRAPDRTLTDAETAAARGAAVARAAAATGAELRAF